MSRVSEVKNLDKTIRYKNSLKVIHSTADRAIELMELNNFNLTSELSSKMRAIKKECEHGLNLKKSELINEINQ